MGYVKIDLRKDGERKTFLMHRLVAKAFIPNPNNYPFVNHKDENKENPKADNLEWCTQEYNTNYGTRNERVSKSHSIKVCQYTKEKTLVKEWGSAKEVQTKNGFDRSAITKCCKGKLKYYKGYIWSYSNDMEVA